MGRVGPGIGIIPAGSSATLQSDYKVERGDIKHFAPWQSMMHVKLVFAQTFAGHCSPLQRVGEVHHR